jgi:hypothetical protein
VNAFKVGDRVRYVGGYTPFYISPRPNAEGTVVSSPLDPDMRWRVTVEWDDRLRYCKETDRRTWAFERSELEVIK